jgi:hypothetical protein
VKAIAIIAVALALGNPAGAEAQPAGSKVIGSGSGQFFVSSRGTISPRSLDLSSQPGMLMLQPELLAVSCDRIKAQLLRELDMPDQWRGKIFVPMHPARSADEAIPVVADRFAGKWQVVMELPDVVERTRFVEAVVRATLLEIANRNARARPAEIPEWLVRGLARELLGSAEVKLILPPPLKQADGWNISRVTVDFSDSPQASASPTLKLNPLAQAAVVLKTNEPLTFDELSWPSEEELTGAGAAIYGSSAQLFVDKLLHEKNGARCLRAMLTELPEYLNWQLAFQHSFEPIFKTPLDVEKWWALEVTQFNGRDLLHLLTREESMKQLDALFQFPIHVQIGTEAPMRADITLQTVIRGWPRPRQLETLKGTLWDLEVLRLRIAPEFIPLVDQYRFALQEYYKKRSLSTRILMDLRLVSDKSAEEAVARLDALDVQRAKLRQQITMPVTTAAQAGLR